jgi:hypothetical protein
VKICKYCFKEFEGQKDELLNPFTELGEMFLIETGEINPADYCPACREELGLMNIAGFGN